MTARCVVVRALGLGDLLTATPALRAIARAFPLHERILCTPHVYAPLVELMGPVIDEIVDTQGVHDVPSTLAVAAKPEVAVNLHGAGPQSTALLAGLEPHRLVAFGTPYGPPWRTREHEVTRWCRLLRAHGIDADPSELLLRVPPPIESLRGAVVVHPGASAASRRWPPARFAEVARRESERGAVVVVTGTADERPLAEHVAAQAGLGAGAVLAGDLDIAGLAALVAHAGCVVCGDTGVAHLASAFATPSVVLFGRTPPTEWGPPPRPCHRVLWRPAHPDPCVIAIGVDDVCAALDALARRQPA